MVKPKKNFLGFVNRRFHLCFNLILLLIIIFIGLYIKNDVSSVFVFFLGFIPLLLIAVGLGVAFDTLFLTLRRKGYSKTAHIVRVVLAFLVAIIALAFATFIIGLTYLGFSILMIKPNFSLKRKIECYTKHSEFVK